ncbi:platelet-derived growth factor receptor beta-like isoform 2-T2 [Polymixia lowei]
MLTTVISVWMRVSFSGSDIMESSPEQPGALFLLLLLHVLFQLCPEGGAALELNPSVSELLLRPDSSFTVVCSGWGQVAWQLPVRPPPDGVLLVDEGTRSLLQLHNATWKMSGNYICEEALSDQTKELDIFIPGRGPEEWFVPTGPSVVMREGEEGTIPCVVSDPKLNVTLYVRSGRTPVNGTMYLPSRGFSGPLRDTSYICVATYGGQERESQVYYVFSIVVPRVMEVEMTWSSLVLRQGEVLTVNCTVKDAEMVFFRWDFPQRKEIEPLMDFLPNRIRSFINISMATPADSGVYMCMVQDTVQGQTVTKNINITVLERGFVLVDPSSQTDVSCLLHQNLELRVDIQAHPPPTVVWTRDNHTVSMETSPVTTTHLTDSRYVSMLTLVRVQMEQQGSYTATVANDDEVREVTFNLEVTAPPRILELSDVSGGPVVLCVSEGTPPPSINWYSCQSTHRCGNKTVAWRLLSRGVEGVSVQENISSIEERGVTQVRSLLTLQSLGTITAVRCEARNHAGRRAWDIRLVSNSLFSQVAVLAAVLALVVIAVIFLIILIVLWRKKPHYEFRWRVIESVSADGQQYSYVDPSQLPYNSAWEIPRDNLVLGGVLGRGAFGRVVEATVYGLLHSTSSTKVAVKMLKSSSKDQCLMTELKVLSYLGPHINIFNLLGACTLGGPVLLIMEFCRHGDLVDYLHRNKHRLQTDVTTQDKSDSDGGYMDMNKEEAGQYVAMETLGDPISYAEIQPALYETPNPQQDQQDEGCVLSLSESPLLGLQDLLSFSYQVAQGMDFLSSKNCIHRDLAARNVLVCDGKLLKVCDFGLARDLRKDDDYIAKGNSFLPVKWMAPESIFECIYTTQSDVWSYGVLLWEIFSLGGSPYPDVPMNQEFCSALKRGKRMACPSHAPHAMYELMRACWEEKPDARPPFSSLVISTGNKLTDSYKKRYVQLSQRFLSGEHPAVARSKPNPATTTKQTDRLQDDHGSHTPQVRVHQSEAEPEEAGPSHVAYIIPITDVTIETSGLVLDTATQQTESPQVLNVPLETGSHDAPGAEEVMSEPSQEADELPQMPCTTEEEESFL